MKVVILSIVIVGISFLLLGVRVLFVKGGKFPSSHVSDSMALKDKGITCAHANEETSKNANNKIKN